jgi:hypothetical protein
MAAAALTRFRCSICNRRLRDGEYVYSRFTKARYCSNIDACRKRARKSKTP